MFYAEKYGIICPLLFIFSSSFERAQYIVVVGLNFTTSLYHSDSQLMKLLL